MPRRKWLVGALLAALCGAALVGLVLWRHRPVAVMTIALLNGRGMKTHVQLADGRVVTYQGDGQPFDLLAAVSLIATLVAQRLALRVLLTRRRAPPAGRAFPELPPGALDRSPATTAPPSSGIARPPGVAPDRMRPDPPG
jgi:hypothetical protein